MTTNTHPPFSSATPAKPLSLGVIFLTLYIDLIGFSIIFPLGPDLGVTWAQCTESTGNDQVKSYRCELKPGYRFQ